MTRRRPVPEVVPPEADAGRAPLVAAQGALAAVAFASLLVASNAMHPLLPIFRQTLGLDPLRTTLTFVSYVGVLCISLLVLSQPRLVRWSPLFLCIALAVAALGDVLLATQSLAGLMIGRALTGLAGGFGTGSASALVFTALGTRGRAISATGNLAGAVVGVSATELCILALGRHAASVAFLGHAVLSLALIAALVPVLWRNRTINRAAFGARDSVGLRNLFPVLRQQWPTVAIGCLSWVTISLSLSLLPSAFAEAGGAGATIAAAIIAYLLSSALAQMLSPMLARIAPWLSGLLAITLGAALVPIGAAVGHPLLALAGFPVLGFGSGLAYRLSLVMLTQGSAAARQGALASLYGAITYGATTLASLATGVVGNLAGLRDTVDAVFLLLALGATCLLSRTPHLADDHRA